jgi:predicted TPR repeat methyltransferase
MSHPTRPTPADELVQEEIVAWMEGSFLKGKERADIVTASEVLLYFSDLTKVFRAVHKCLAPSGYFVASFEALEPVLASMDPPSSARPLMSKPYHQRPSGRHAHRLSYIESTARAAGFDVLRTINNVTLRLEWGKPEQGHFILCQRPGVAAAAAARPSATELTRRAKEILATAAAGGNDGGEGGGGGSEEGGKKKEEAALALFEQALSMEPDKASHYNNVGVALLRLGRYTEAADRFAECLRLRQMRLEQLGEGGEEEGAPKRRILKGIRLAKQNLKRARMEAGRHTEL